MPLAIFTALLAPGLMISPSAFAAAHVAAPAVSPAPAAPAAAAASIVGSPSTPAVSSTGSPGSNKTTLSTRPFKGADYSGVYDCTGDDGHEGKYTATVTLTLQPKHSRDAHGAYALKMEVPGYGIYLGHVVSMGKMLAIHFALTDPATRDFGTGLATISTSRGRLRFQKYYYQPEFKGGNHGLEDCVRR